MNFFIHPILISSLVVMMLDVSIVADASAKGIPKKGVLKKEFNKQARKNPPKKPPEKPSNAGLKNGPKPPSNFKNPGF